MPGIHLTTVTCNKLERHEKRGQGGVKGGGGEEHQAPGQKRSMKSVSPRQGRNDHGGSRGLSAPGGQHEERA